MYKNEGEQWKIWQWLLMKTDDNSVEVCWLRHVNFQIPCHNARFILFESMLFSNI